MQFWRPVGVLLTKSRVYKKRNYSFPYKFGFGRIIRIRYIPMILLRGKNGKIWENFQLGLTLPPDFFEFQNYLKNADPPSSMKIQTFLHFTYYMHGRWVGVCPEYLQYSVFSDECYIFIITQWSR